MSHFLKKIYNKYKSADNNMYKKVIALTWPAFIELFMSTLFGMVDMIMVGRLSSSAIAAIGLTQNPFMLLLAAFAAVNIGTTTLVAWSTGAGDTQKASLITRQTLIINIFLGTIMSLIGIFLSPYIVRFMGANTDTFKDANIYFQIISSGLLFQTVTMGITAALRGAGETRLPMVYNIASNLFNVFGNYVLIYGKFGFPKLGVQGAAISTTVSRFLACAFALYIVYIWRKSPIHISVKTSYRPDFKIIKQIFYIGTPAAFEQIVLHSGLMMFARIVSGLGTAAFAAHQIGLNISGLTFAPSMAFGVASTTLVGQSLGAGDKQKAQKFANITHRTSVAVACIIGLIFLLFSYQLAALYTKDKAVIAAAGLVLKIMAFAQTGQSTQLSIAGALRGAGDTMYPLYASIFGIWIFRVCVAFVFVYIFNWGLIGAWVALLIDQYMRATIVYLRFRSGRWKDVKARSSKLINSEVVS